MSLRYRYFYFAGLILSCLLQQNGHLVTAAETSAGQTSSATTSPTSENDPDPGHSQHGEAFDDGPRQAAQLFPGNGGPAFPVTTKSELAQQFINQGVGQLHGFWYWEAERSFRQAALHDPDCAMAFWGMALANANNDKRATAFIRSAMKLKDKVSPRELLYLELQSNYYEALDKEKKDSEKKDNEKKATENKPGDKSTTDKQPADTKSTDTEKKSSDDQPKRAADDERPIEDCQPALEDEPKTDEAKPAAKNTEQNSVPLAAEATKLKELQRQLEQQQQELKKQQAELKKQAEEQKKREEIEQRKTEARLKKEAEDSKKKAKRDRIEARIKGWDKLVQEYPDDTHAAAFYVYQVWHDRDVVPINNMMLVDAMLDKIFVREPLHPAHHYRIHLWDNNRPKNAVTSAALNGPAAPAIAHMWHMPGHTYSKLKRFHDAVYQQEASARVDHAYMQRDQVMPYQIHNYAHNNEWCIRNLLTIGRVNDALNLSKNLIEIPRHPKLNNGRDNSTAGAYGRDRWYDTVVRNELWPQMIELANTTYLREPEINEVAELRRRRYWGVALALTGKLSEAEQQVAWFEAKLKELKPAAPPQSPSKNPDPKPADPKAKACEPAPADQMTAESKTTDPKYADQKSAAVAEKPSGDKQPPAEKPTAAPPATRKKSEIDDLTRRCDESLLHIRAALATAAGKHKDALALYKKVGNLPKEQLTWAMIEAGDFDAAVKTAKDQLRSADKSVIARAAYVAALWHKGDQTTAKTEFATLRQLAATADLSLPALTRLSNIAKEFEYPSDWRLPIEPASDLGERPALNTLGPLTWTPRAAQNWNLADHQGKQWSLKGDFDGQPVVVIFYLGHGCIHCVEQLNTFGPLTKEYEQAGIKLIAISTDNQEQLEKSYDQANETGGLPFPLVANPDQQIFQKYRCYDDFERRAMHGTFLIDAQGKIRWQDIGPEPFTDAKFLLQESQRLLGLTK